MKHSVRTALERLLANSVAREMKPLLAKRSVSAEEEGPRPGRSVRTELERRLARQSLEAEAKQPLAVHPVQVE